MPITVIKINMNNLECQKDELSALQSIYTEDEFSIFEEEGYVGGKFSSVLELPSPFVIAHKEIKDGAVADREFKVEFLPPIVLQFTLPDDYPSVSPPSFNLCCSWLNRKLLSQLCVKLDELWRENEGMEILFLWFQFLKEESLNHLNINGKLDISKTHFHHCDYLGTCDRKASLDMKANPSNAEQQEIVKQLKLPGKSHCPSINSADFKDDTVVCNISKEIIGNSSLLESESQKKMPSNKVVLDPRAVMEINPATTIVTLLREYDEKQKNLLFNKKLITCEICFQQKLGQHCAMFDTCGHIFCRECITEYFAVQIKDGNVRGLNCPEPKCDKQASLSLVKELVSPELFAKYDSVLLSSTLDTLTDIAYCPRTFCQYPVTIDPEEKMAHCPNCEYNFCIYCRMVYHGVEPCKFRSVSQKKLAEQYKNADEGEQAHLEKKYGKKQLQLLLESYLSESWIVDNSQNCPTCNAAIEKSYGCNKMVCWKCNTYFCWLCKSRLSRLDPYLHFRSINSPCYNLLFEGVDDQVDDDVWMEEYVPFL
ncbi:hypothetical protein J437_LFUL004086 [Ladona fulva]|uniref:RBR-type E3 ubiquitin transferase n=1 Tax=Ladona fulva TaxID=123851 RepID=A0A8K0K3X0_LADFU|nr:hypothetical protein J437_LFUL004086 [Ladona fulva]